MTLDPLNTLVRDAAPTPKMPVLFLGHGNPMNAIEENEFVEGFRRVGATLHPKPHAILCISAHWETRGTLVTAMPKPRTIHDFGGFPKALFEVQYPAPGDPVLAEETRHAVTSTDIGLDYAWGLDHGAWSVIKHLYPEADVPVIQMSLDYTQPASYHYELARQLATFRNKGILIVGSGNMVHNLRLAAWNRMAEPGFAYDWAAEADEKMKQLIQEGNHRSLVDFEAQGKPFQLSIPTPEHYLPLLYTLALQEKDDNLSFFNEQLLAGSLSMRSVKLTPGM